MKISKILALILAIALVSVMFSGCKALDRARDNHAYYTGDTINEINYRGKIYKLLPDCEDFDPLWEEDSSRTISEKDVPILITLFTGARNITVLKDDELIHDSYQNKAYARVDVYGKYEELFSSYKLTKYVYWHSFWNETLDVYDNELKEVDAADLTTIREAVKMAQVTETPEYGFYGEEFNIMITDDTGLFRRNSIDMINSEGTVYIMDRGVTYKVSDEYTNKVNEIIEKYLYTNY